MYVGALKRDFFHPTVFYVFCQCVTLGISYLKISPSMSDFKIVTWFAWLGAMAAFILGSMAYYLIKPETVELEKSRTMEVGREYNWKLHFVFSLIFVAIFAVGAFLVSRAMGGMYLMSVGQKTLRSSVQASAFANVSFASSPFVVVTLMVASFKSINPYKCIRIASFFLAICVIILSVCVYPGRNALFLCLGFLYSFSLPKETHTDQGDYHGDRPCHLIFRGGRSCPFAVWKFLAGRDGLEVRDDLAL